MTKTGERFSPKAYPIDDDPMTTFLLVDGMNLSLTPWPRRILFSTENRRRGDGSDRSRNGD
ncbi:MAG: hypothetical protein WBN04_18940 [Paracoccaceae bacterium]